MNMVQASFPPDSLREQLPSITQRYDNVSPTTSEPAIIPSGLLSPQSFRDTIRTNLPDGWQGYQNPAEGKSYFRNAALRIVTESNIGNEQTLGRVIAWHQALAPLLNKSTRDDYDIVLNVSEDMDDDMGKCGYYLVDYSSEVVFWLREVSTTSMGLPDVRSRTHLGLLLSEQFWVHCEYMPPPHLNFTSKAQGLLATLGTLSIDASSSTGSVSPFHQDECESYSRSLAQVLKTDHRMEINWCLARLKSLLTQSRLINLFGEPNARTDRNVIVNGQTAPPETAAFAIWSMLLFSIPSIYLARWNGIWVDRVTYTREWKKLTKDMMEEFLYGLIMSGVMLIAGIVLLGLTSSAVVRVLAAVGLLMSLGGGWYSALLFSTLRTAGGCAADAANFIQMNENYTTGLQGMALRHSIPWALIVWSGICIFISAFWEIFMDMIKFLQPLIRFSGQDMMVPVLVSMTYLYGRGYFSLTRLRLLCTR